MINTQRADALSWDGRQLEAREALGQVIESLNGLRRLDPDDAQLPGALATAWIKVGESYEDTDEADAPKQMLDAYRKAHPLYEELASADRADLNAKRMLALSSRKLGYALAQNEQFDEGQTQLRQSLNTLQRLSAEDAANLDHRRDIANTLYRMSQLEQLRGRPRAAIPYAREILDIRRQVLKAAPDSGIFRRDLAVTLDLLAELQPESTESCTHLTEADGIWSALKAEGATYPTDEAEMTNTAELAATCGNAD